MRKITSAIMLCLLFYTAFSVYAQKNPAPVDLVYPQLDSENSRWIFFSSASRPFGMVNLFPDNRTNGDWGSGYRYEIDTIKGFSHIHEWQLSGLSVMPVTVTTENKTTLFVDFSSKFSHASETIKPGYHAVFLDRYGVKAEMTATFRVGFHRYLFPEKSKPAILINLNGELGPCIIKDGQLHKTVLAR
jgi:putative alpha-1,2-mannosidase